jgi:hypothetical protein
LVPSCAGCLPNSFTRRCSPAGNNFA